jgi:hypothetical protein
VIRNFFPAGVWRRGLLCLAILSGLDGLGPVSGRASGVSDKLKPQDRYALIFGTVWSPDGNPVYGVTVKLRRARDKHARWEVFSNHRGEFAQRVPAGKTEYIVWADVKSFKTIEGVRYGAGEAVHVAIDNDERADIGLHLTKAVQ